MEMWEYVRRLLAGATGENQSFMPGLIAGAYFRDLIAQNLDTKHPIHEFSDLADLFSEQLQDEGFIRPAGVRSGPAAILGARERTQLGDQLLEALSRRGGVNFFEGAQADINGAAVLRLLHQLDS
ncbi:hypothetical protein [Pseudomonas sp. lyk4-TYG-107]|uniref:hypothetical protein n=1 Tax=Pseudomonas sp. lyk4-TYG-107 TaxID=3040317 RepID=UPI002555CC9D|nr:hypothetical protein [Pseudomonas sp. lyk4-TYG-107]